MNGKRFDPDQPDVTSQRQPHGEAPLPETDGALSVPAPVKQSIESALGEVLPQEDVPKATRRVLQVIAEVSPHHGPIPPPETFQAYDTILPGAADRILSMAEREQAHRMEWERTAIEAESRNSTLGLSLGITALLLLVAGALGALLLGSPTVAGLFVGTTALGLIPAFIRGRGLLNWFGGPNDAEPSRRRPEKQP